MIKTGDLIRDIEDGDCFNLGVVTQVKDEKVVKYKLLAVVWNGYKHQDDRENQEIEPEWWIIEKLGND